MKNCMLVFLCIILVLMPACVSKGGVTDHLPSEANILETGCGEIIDSGQYYRIYGKNTTQVYYEIYDLEGNTVLSEITDRPLKIEMVNSDIIDIRQSMGTGLTVHRYFSVVQNQLSDDYLYVLDTIDEIVAYIDIPEKNSFENRKVVIQNLFDKNAFYREYSFDFSRVDAPVIEAQFSNDGTLLLLTYLSGEEQEQITKALKWRQDSQEDDVSVSHGKTE